MVFPHELFVRVGHIVHLVETRRRVHRFLRPGWRFVRLFMVFPRKPLCWQLLLLGKIVHGFVIVVGPLDLLVRDPILGVSRLLLAQVDDGSTPVVDS